MLAALFVYCYLLVQMDNLAQSLEDLFENMVKETVDKEDILDKDSEDLLDWFELLENLAQSLEEVKDNLEVELEDKVEN